MSTRETQGPKSPVDRLVEAGLAAYGRGELDDALVAWEQALALDPDDARALGYVDYVRQHYELVTGAAEVLAEEDLGVPFGLGADDGDYEIEVTLQRPPPTDAPTVRLSSPPLFDAIDEGWSLDDDPMARAQTVESPGLTLEIEADEPPADFEQDRTNEYQSGMRRRQPGPSSPGLLPAAHPPEPGTDEFSTLEATTGLGQRALGFVQPNPRAKRASRPELKVNIRTPDGRSETLGAAPADPEHTSTLSLDHVPSRAPSEGDDALGPALGEDDEIDLPPPPGRTLDFSARSEGPTRDLGVRAKSQSEPAASIGQAVARHVERDLRDLRADTVPEPAAGRSRTADLRARIIAEVDRAAPAGEAADQRTRRRIAALIELGQAAAKALQLDRAVMAIDAAFAEDPDSALAHKLLQQNREAIFGVLHDYLGDLDRRPRLAVALHDVRDEPLDSRAAFLLSRVDGSLTFEELLDVSGMPRLEAGRYLCQLVARGLLAVD